MVFFNFLSEVKIYDLLFCMKCTIFCVNVFMCISQFFVGISGNNYSSILFQPLNL